MEFEEWKNKYVRSHENIDFDKIILEDMVEAWNAALLNLPTCETCSHWESANDYKMRGIAREKNQENKEFKLVINDGFHLCYVSGYEHTKDWGCKFHSIIEQLRKDNDNY